MHQRAHSRHSLQALKTLALLCLVAPAAAENLPFPPLQKYICTPTHIVDKEKLASYLIRKYPLSVLALSSDPKLHQVDSRQQILTVLLAAPKLCADRCGPSDQDYLDAIQGHVDQILAGSLAPSLKPSASVDAAEYFQGPNEQNQIVCATTEDGAPVEAPGAGFTPPATSASHFRVRGDPSQLNIDRTHKQDFAATDKATIGLGQNYVADSRTSNITGYIGYAFASDSPYWKNGNRMELIPYVGVNRNIVRVSGSIDAANSNDTANFGLLGSFYVIGANERGAILGHQLSIRPDYLADYADGSRLLTLNFEYTPVKNGFINDYIRLGSIASVKPMFSIRSSNGAYTNRGNAAVASVHENFSRLGGHLGFALTSEKEQIPLDFTTTYTGLAALRGNTKVSYFKNSLTYSFDPKKYFGLSLNSSHGTREDTAKTEKLWEIAFTARF